MTPPSEPVDPFAGDPDDPSRALEALDEDPELALEPLSPDEREDVLVDLQDLEVFEALLAPRGVRGLVVDCEDCREPHYFAWALLRGNLRHLLDRGTARVHEPAFSPDPSDYVTWDYARGYTDACLEPDDQSASCGTLYASSDFGVRRLRPASSTCEEAARGLPDVEVAGLTTAPQGDTLYAATHGLAAYRLDLGWPGRCTGSAGRGRRRAALCVVLVGPAHQAGWEGRRPGTKCEESA